MRPVHVHRLLIPLLAALAATAHAESSKTRAKVQAEMIDARRSGDVIASGESGLTLRELYPQRYPAVTAAGKTREQVVAELKEAQRTGDIAVASALAASAASAKADDTEALRSQVDTLLRKVSDLDRRQAAAIPTTGLVTGGATKGSFRLPGSDTSVTLGGYVKLDALYS